MSAIIAFFILSSFATIIYRETRQDNFLYFFVEMGRGMQKLSTKAELLLRTAFFADPHNKVLIGHETKDFDYQCEKTYLRVEGTLIIKGSVDMRRGSLLEVLGTVSIGHSCVICPHSRIRAYNSITLGNYVRVSHESQIFDSNFHPTCQLADIGNIRISQPVSIGNYVWICNRSTISKGAMIPDYTIVASYSLVTRDFSNLPPNSLIGGIPARVLSSDYVRIWDTQKDFRLMLKEFPWYRERYKIYNDFSD